MDISISLILLAIIQSMFLTAGQVCLKIALQRMDTFSWTWHFWNGSIICNWQFALCGVFYLIAIVMWFHILKNFPLSQAYPMVSLSYVFGMLAAIVFFHEEVDFVQWVGVFMIISGCFLIAR